MADVQLIRYFMNVALVDSEETIEDRLIKELIATKKAYEKALGRERELESIIKQKNDDNQRAKIELQSELQAKLAELKQKNEKCDTCNGLRIHAAHSINQGKTIAELEEQRDNALKLCEIRARECDDLRCDRNAKNGINAALQRERNDLRENCAALENKVMKLERELDILQKTAKLDVADDKIARLAAEREALTAEVKLLYAEIKELKEIPPLVQISPEEMKQIKEHNNVDHNVYATPNFGNAIVVGNSVNTVPYWNWKSTAVSVDINAHNQIVADRNAVIEGLNQQVATLRQENERLKCKSCVKQIEELQDRVASGNTRIDRLIEEREESIKDATTVREEAKRLAEANMLMQETLATKDTIIKMLANPPTTNYPNPNH